MQRTKLGTGPRRDVHERQQRRDQAIRRRRDQLTRTVIDEQVTNDRIISRKMSGNVHAPTSSSRLAADLASGYERHITVNPLALLGLPCSGRPLTMRAYRYGRMEGDIARISYDQQAAAASKAVREIPRDGLLEWREAVRRHLRPSPGTSWCCADRGSTVLWPRSPSTPPRRVGCGSAGLWCRRGCVR